MKRIRWAILLLGCLILLGASGCMEGPSLQSYNTVIADETITIPAGYYKYYKSAPDIGDILDISLTATQDVDFYLFDEDNFWKWRQGKDFTADMAVYDVSSFSRTFEVGNPNFRETGCFFVIYNPHTQDNSSITIKITQSP